MHFVAYLSLQVFDEVEQFNYSHFSAVELRNRRAKLFAQSNTRNPWQRKALPWGFLQDIIKTQLQRWDTLKHKKSGYCSRMEFYLGCLSFRPACCVVVECKFVILEERKKTLEKEVKAEILSLF